MVDLCIAAVVNVANENELTGAALHLRRGLLSPGPRFHDGRLSRGTKGQRVSNAQRGRRRPPVGEEEAAARRAGCKGRWHSVEPPCQRWRRWDRLEVQR